MARSCSISSRFFVLFSIWHMCFQCFATAANTLSANHQSIKDGETLVSANKLFKLGFFSLTGGDRYVGIWYSGSSQTNQTVWVANRENPLYNTTGILSLQADGNLVVSFGNGTVVWSTNLPAQSANSSIAVLEDSGNLVVREEISGSIQWESFDEPFDTLLPGMKIGINLRTGRTRMLTAMRSENDPFPGIYAFGIDPQDPNQFFIWRGSVPYWRVFFWNGTSYNVILRELIIPIKAWNENASVVRTDDEVYFTIAASPPTPLRRLVIGPFASLTRYEHYADGGMSEDFFAKQPCSTKGICGPNSSCNENQDPMCKCLPGFKPLSLASWNKGEWRDGCTPRQELQCGVKDGYLTLKNAKFPLNYLDFTVENATMCKKKCNDEECTCRAYAWAKDEFDQYFCYRCLKELTGLKEDARDDDGIEFLYPHSELNIRVVSSVSSNEDRRCGTCGTNIVPYPLSTEPSCGDPAYNSFNCNSSSGLLYFHVPHGLSYPISSINPETRTFVIKPKGIDLCWVGSAKRMDIHLNGSLPFRVTKNNTVLLLNCSTTPNKTLQSNCSYSSPCHRYIQGGRAPCFHSKMCCSYTSGGFKSISSHRIGVLDSQCSSYASIINLDLSAGSVREWNEGVQIEWDAPIEPVCDSDKDCHSWPNSSCRTHNAQTLWKRCLCNDNFRWDPLRLNCTPDGSRNNQSLVIPPGSSKNKHLTLIFTATAAGGIILLVAFTYSVLRSKNRTKASFPTNELLELANGNDNVEVPFVDFKCIVEATEKFSDSNKLGRGGFGPVYKGKLQGGQEIAIKRLSKCSGQGLEEFKNELLLIARLQHRNLVRMLGYCIAEDEKMLIYEYMPNRSLDFFLFDPNQGALLDWEKRFNIILGVTRGLLYLHQDSRLRIIHRDLKTSNILLDKDMNPKISDFGLARIFGGDQAQETTNRVVGTYGYMAPEYAADGLFSVKSDVFSFGIILLEIVSGKKNVGFYNHGHASNLPGYAWQLWKEGDGLNLLDPCLFDSSNPTQALRCIHLALLCVQENAEDRPIMASVLAVLESEIASLPTPREPAFFRRRFPRTVSNSLPSQTPKYSNNELTLSGLEGR